MDLQEETGELKIEDQCVENKQSTAASCSTVVKGSASSFHKSPTTPSPATTSLLHRSSGPIRRAKGRWSPKEDEALRRPVGSYKGKNRKKIGLKSPVKKLASQSPTQRSPVKKLASQSPTRRSVMKSSI